MMPAPPRQLFYGGHWSKPLAGGSFESINPATQQSLGVVANAQQEDVDLAIEAAANAFESWAAIPPLEHASYLRPSRGYSYRPQRRYCSA